MEQMKTQSDENSKSKNEKLVVFIVEKQTNSVQQVNYSVNSTNFFFHSYCDQLNSCANISRMMTTFITLEISKHSLSDLLLGC